MAAAWVHRVPFRWKGLPSKMLITALNLGADVTSTFGIWPSSSAFFLARCLWLALNTPSPGVRVWQRSRKPDPSKHQVTLGFPRWPLEWPGSLGLPQPADWERWHHRPPNQPGVSSSAHTTDQYPLPLFSLILFFSSLAVQQRVSFVYVAFVHTRVHNGDGCALLFGPLPIIALHFDWRRPKNVVKRRKKKRRSQKWEGFEILPKLRHTYVKDKGKNLLSSKGNESA